VKLATWNVNSIRARHERLVAWIGEHRPDVLCLQETKVEDHAFPAMELRALGYDVAMHGQRTYNGVAILSRTPMTDVRRGFGDGDDESQTRLIAATIAGVRVLSVYVPNGESVGTEKYRWKLAWMERLRRHLATVVAPERPLVLCGDFNVAPAPTDVHDPVTWEGRVLFSAEERQALRAILGVGLDDLLRTMHPTEPLFTWWDYRMLAFPKGRGLRIDHVLVTPALAARATASGVDRESRKGKQPSDHAAVWAEFRDV
jgi:exodeoxyribonuclease-3